MPRPAGFFWPKIRNYGMGKKRWFVPVQRRNIRPRLRAMAHRDMMDLIRVKIFVTECTAGAYYKKKGAQLCCCIYRENRIP